MSFLSQPQALVEVRLWKYPASAGTLVLRYAKRPVSIRGAFFEPRLQSVSSIKRAATDPDGNYEVGSASIALNDEDGEVSALLKEGTQTEYWVAREFIVYLPSQELLDSQPSIDDLQPIFRGWITNVQTPARQVTIDAADCVGSLMSASNLDRKVLSVQVKNLTNTPNADTKDLFIPLAIGEFSDMGALDENNAPAKRGLAPVIEVCEIDITDINGTPAPTFVAPPVITASSVVGATGQETRYYAATVISPFGESMLSNVVACDGASVRNLGNYNSISGTFDQGDPLNPNKVRIWYGPSADHMVGWLDEANYGSPGEFGYLDGAANWPSPFRDENDIIKYMDAPQTNQAQSNPNIFSVMAFCMAYGYDILELYGSDLAEGVEPRRKIFDASDYGVTTIRPTDPQWPFPNPWFEMNGFRFFGFLQRGPKLNAHRDGSVTIAGNFGGPHDNAGNLIDQAMRQLVVLFNDFCVKNNGTGYTNQNFGTLETYADGTPLLQTSSFEAVQNKTKEWLANDVGYQGNIWISDPELTWRDVIQKCCQSFGIRFAANRFGQIKVFVIDTSDDGYDGRIFRERIEIKRYEDPNLAHEEVVNQITMQFFWDPDAGEFRGTGLPAFQQDQSIAAMVPGGVIGQPNLRGVKPQSLDIVYSAYHDTAYDVVGRELLRRKRRLRYVPVTVPYLGLDYDLGDRGRLTSTRGLGYPGDSAEKVVILGHEVHPDDEEVTLSFLDVGSVTIGVNSVLGDEDAEPSTAEEIGDEESDPPTAKEIG